MKAIRTIFALAALVALPLGASAQDPVVHKATKYYTDSASAAHGYVEVNGIPGSKGITIQGEVRGDNGIPQHVRQLTNWTDRNAHAVYYFYHPKARTTTTMRYTVQRGRTAKLRLILSDPDGDIKADTINLELTGTGSPVVDTIVNNKNYRTAKYYRYDFECLEGNNYITNIDEFFFSTRTSGVHSYVANYLSSPSVHLSNWRSTDPTTPSGNIFDFAYMEVMIPKSSDIVGTYAMSLGVLKGYMGIQNDGWDSNGNVIHDIIFSMWDSGSSDADPNLPDYLRAGAVDANPEANLYNFHGEGTGAGCRLNGYRWYPDTFVQFICNARPEKTSYWTVENGDSVEHPQNNVLVTAWFNAQDGKGWQYLATTRIRNTGDLIGGWYSFLENYNWPTGDWNRRAYYRNGYMHEYSTGKWHNMNLIGFGHTDGGNAIGARNDYGQGKTSEKEFPNTFYMQSGGYVNHTEGDTQIALATDFTPVDTIALEPLLARVQLAVDKEKQKQEDEANFTKYTYKKTGWKIIEKSSEETSGEGAVNGRANCIIDDNADTYWHSKWQGGAAQMPHTLAVDMQKVLPVGAFQITMSNGGGNRTIKSMEMYASSDSSTSSSARKDWTLVYKNEDVPNETTFRFMLDSLTNMRYFRLRILDGYGNPFVRINEVDVSAMTPSTTGINDVTRLRYADNVQLVTSGRRVTLVPDGATISRATLKVYKADGRVVLRKAMTADGDVLATDISGLEPGVYLLVADWDNGSAARKFVVR